MYTTTATSEILTSCPQATSRETTRTRMLRAVKATSTTERQTDADVSAWAHHARAANGFGDAGID